MIKGAIAFALFCTVPAIILWHIVQGLRTGVLRGRGGPLARADHPVAFWVILIAYTVPLVMWLYFLGIVALNVWRDGWN